MSTNQPSKIRSFLISGVCLLTSFAASGCGSADSETAGAESVVRVTGTLSDWAMSDVVEDGGRFSGYQFVLMDALSGRAYRSTVSGGGGFIIADVPSERNYYGILLDGDVRFGKILLVRKGVQEHQVFRLPGNGVLGSLSIESSVLRSSNQDALVPVPEFVFADIDVNGIPDGLESPSAANSAVENTVGDLDLDGMLDSVDTDLDNDGVPNCLDDDIDDDGIPNLFDNDSTQDTAIDAQSSGSENPLTAVPGFGFHAVFQEAVALDGGGFTRTLWLVFEGGPQAITGVTVESGSFLTGATYERAGGEAFAGSLFNDGSHGDGLADDNLWSALVVLDTAKTFLDNHVLIFTVTLPGGGLVEFLYRMPPPITDTLTAAATTWDSDSTTVDVAWEWTTKQDSSLYAAYEVVLLDSAGTRIYSSGKLAPAETGVHSIPVSNLDSTESYACIVRALTPSPMTGFPGSVARSAKLTVVDSTSE